MHARYGIPFPSSDKLLFMTPAEEFVYSELLNGKCVSVRSIMQRALHLGFTREEIHETRERNPNIEARGKSRDNACWQFIRLP